MAEADDTPPSEAGAAEAKSILDAAGVRPANRDLLVSLIAKALDKAAKRSAGREEVVGERRAA